MENKTDIIKALINFQGKVPIISLNSKVQVKLKSGGTYIFEYADLPHITKVIQPALTESELCIHFQIKESQMTLFVVHSSGSFLDSVITMNFSNNAQENASLITYYKRYLLVAALNLSADKDDDGNKTLGNKTISLTKKETPITKLKLELNTENYNKVLSALIGEYTMDQVKNKYILTKEVENSLLDDIQIEIENKLKEQENGQNK